jgi:hypothetical protein
MKVAHRLTAVFPLVANHAKTRFRNIFPRCDFIDQAGHLSDQGGVSCRERREPRHMLTWNDQNVDGALGVDVRKGQAMTVLCYDAGWNLARYNSTKQAICHHQPPVGPIFSVGFL